MTKTNGIVKLLLTFGVVFGFGSIRGQQDSATYTGKAQATFRVAFYNVENLFDTIDDAGVHDEEFLPNSQKSWSSWRYQAKVANMAKVIRAVGGWQPPDIIGLVEVENRGVMIDVTQHPVLRNANYGIVHFDSDDARGIDVGLCYRTENIEVLQAQALKINTLSMLTRDILYAALLLNKKDTLHIFVNHWPSRRGGKEASEHKRVWAAQNLKHKTDSILQASPNAAILAMGDFNDTPNDSSLHVLSEAPNFALNNLMTDLPQTEGSHKYHGVWDYLDQILVSDALMGGGYLSLAKPTATVFRASFLLEVDDRYSDFFPKRTWKGDYFINGFSDHLPVYVDIQTLVIQE